MKPRKLIAACVSCAVMAALACAAVAASGTAAHPAGALVVTKGQAVKQIAGDGRRLVWETGPLEGDNTLTKLFERDRGGRSHVLVRNVKSTYGLGLASGWVVYADGGARARLSVSRPDGSRRIVLSRWLAAPFATRGRLVAWIAQEGQKQKVVVRDMRTGRVLLVVRPRRCENGHCYQLEQVTLADGGVVFTRDSTNPDVSFVVRVRFSPHRRTRVQIRNDPQPNLAPSSAGALYYALGLGWYRWDFGRSPHRAPFRANPPAPILGYEHGRWLLSTRSGCDYGVVALTGQGHRTIVAAPRRLERIVPSRARLCVVLQGSTWVGAQPLTAWAVIPRKASEEHEDEGLFGLGFAGKLLR